MTATRSTPAFDPEQIPLVGTSFIEASAGTGKTYALTTLYLRLLIEHDLRPADILVVTFTNPATAELRERIRGRIREAIAEGRGEVSTSRLQRALQDFDEAAIFTIHGFCQRTLQENAFESGLAFDAELIEKPEARERTLAHDLWNRLLAGEDEAFREWLIAGSGKRWAFEPEALFKEIVLQLGADAEMPVLPALDSVAATESPARLVADADLAWREFAERWGERKDVVISQLTSDAARLHKGKYKPETIKTRWVAELDDVAQRVEEATSPALRAGISPPEIVSKYLTHEMIDLGVGKGGARPTDPFFETCSALVLATEALSDDFDARALSLRRRFVDAVRAAAERRREVEHILYFDDLLAELRGALRGEDGERLRDALRARYRFALIDEFQDTDAVQYEIFETVWHDATVAKAGGGLVLIGDPKQAIYGFRGADIHTYLAARANAAAAVHALEVNYRSDPPVIHAVNALFGAAPPAFGTERIEFHPVTAAQARDRDAYHAPERFRAGLRVAWLSREAAAEIPGGELGRSGEIPLRFARTRWMKAVARDVAELLESGATIGGRPIAPSDVAILARRRVELDGARRALEALGIPCVSRGEGNVFESREAWELASVLAAWLQPGDPRRLRAALSTGAHDLDSRAIAALSDDSPALADFTERYAEYGRLWSELGFARAFQTWRAREAVSEKLLALGDGDRRHTNWLHLAELLARVANERGASRTGLLAWLERATFDETLRLELGAEASLLRLERDDEAVQLVTLHGSKGLEYEIVYLPALWETFEPKAPSAERVEKGEGKRPPIRFHDPMAGRTLDLGIQGDAYSEHLALQQAEASAEHRRLLYVGLTRARRHCVVYWGCAGPAFAKSPLAHLVLGARSAAEEKASGADFEKWAKGLGDGDWLDAWQAIAKNAPDGAIRIEVSELESRKRWKAREVEAVELELAPVRPLVLRALATTSFTGLVRGAYRGTSALEGPLASGRDLDADVDSGTRIEDAMPDLAAAMHLFPRGAEAGTLLHDVLEQSDLAVCDDDAIRLLAEESLGRSPLARIPTEREIVPQIVHVVRSVARTPLRAAPRSFCLADVAEGQLRPELEFTLSAPGDERGRGFSAEALARVLADAPAGSPLERYAPRAASLSWPVLAGHLRGFIDAVFCDGERYFVVDYKSNHLGARQRDYLPERLVLPMIEHDYVLQYLLYVVALDRHLATRIADYDYERHFGGAYYLFLRGMAEAHAPGCGIFFDRPDAESVRRVSDLLGRPGGKAR